MLIEAGVHPSELTQAQLLKMVEFANVLAATSTS